MSLGLVVALLSTFIPVPGRPVRAQAHGRELTLQGNFTVPLVGVVDVGTLPQLPLSREARVAVRKTKPFLVPNHGLLEKAKALKPDAARSAKGSRATAAGSAPRRTPDAAGPGPGIVTGAPIYGLSQLLACGGCEPPDTQVGADPNYLFEATNTAGVITDKAGNVLALFDLHFFTPGEPPDFFISDPKVRFDPLSGVWFFSIISLSGAPDGSGLWWLGVSQPFDPFRWTVYSFEGVPGTFPDFDALGISDDKVVLTANAFDFAFNFVAAEVLVLNKAELEAGSSSIDAALFAGSAFFTIQPAHSLSATGGPLFMASSDNGASAVYHVFTVMGVPPGPVSIPFNDVFLDLVNVGPLVIPPGAAQAGTSNRIDTGDNRALDVAYRDGVMWVTANDGCVDSSFNFLSCVRFTQINTGTMATTQDLDLGEPGGNFYYGAIQVVPDPTFPGTDDVIAVFTESSPSDFPSVMVSGRMEAIDSPSTFRAPVLIQSGLAPYLGTRWGDYSGAGMDPALFGTVWVAGEFTLFDGEWWTVIENVGFACTASCF